MEKIRIGILGYGNLGKGVELAVSNSADLRLVGIFTRREEVITAKGKALHISKVRDYKDQIDVMILCGGSATDLFTQGREMLSIFNTVDSFDNHGKIPEYYNMMDATAKESDRLGIISVGWDPGLFSMARTLFESVLPKGDNYTFWGKGVSQGHSDAIRRIKGVVDARQYTIPSEKAIEQVLQGLNPQLSTRDKHIRECYVVAEEGADLQKIKEQIINMPNYFADFDTIVHFVDREELQKNHSRLPHGGKVIRSGDTYSDNKSVLEFSINLGSNPEFTGSVLTAYARAVHRMYEEGKRGCMTVFDVPLAKISPLNSENIIKTFL